jgi:selenide,water dikinase
MLPGLIAGHYSRRDAHIDLERLAHRASARFICDAVVGIDATRRLAYCAQHAEASYDWLSLDIGSVPNTESIREAERFGFPVRPVDRLLAGVDALAQRVRQSDIEVAIIGAGAGGVELSCSRPPASPRRACASRAFFHPDAHQ